MGDDSEKPKSKIYYDFEEAWNETRFCFSFGSNKDKAAATAKLVGKSLFNTGIFAGREGFKIIKELPGQIEKTQMKREETREKYAEKSDSELKKIIKDDSFFGASPDEKLIARKILRERNG